MLSDSQRAAAAARAERADAARPIAAARAERRAGADEPAVAPDRPERTPLPPPLPGRECLEPGCGLARVLDNETGLPVDGIDRCGLHLR